MNDQELAKLFQKGTAPEREHAFLERTDLYLRRQRRISTLLNGARICCVAMLVAGLFVLAQVYQTTFGARAAGSMSLTGSMVVPLVVVVICSLVALVRKPIH